VIAPTAFKGRVRFLPSAAAQPAAHQPSAPVTTQLSSSVHPIPLPLAPATSASFSPPARLPLAEAAISNSSSSPSNLAATPLRDNLIDDWATMDEAHGWRTIEAEFGMVIASNVTHIGYNAHVAPRALFDDGCVDLLIIRGTDRKTLLSFLLGLEEGSHTDLQGLEYHKARAFAIEPLTPAGCFALDGEWTEYTPLRCQVHKGLLTLFC
jgi:sphingosine kinase